MRWAQGRFGTRTPYRTRCFVWVLLMYCGVHRFGGLAAMLVPRVSVARVCAHAGSTPAACRVLAENSRRDPRRGRAAGERPRPGPRGAVNSAQPAVSRARPARARYRAFRLPPRPVIVFRSVRGARYVHRGASVRFPLRDLRGCVLRSLAPPRRAYHIGTQTPAHATRSVVARARSVQKCGIGHSGVDHASRPHTVWILDCEWVDITTYDCERVDRRVVVFDTMS